MSRSAGEADRASARPSSKVQPRFWADVPPDDRLLCAELEPRPEDRRNRCVAAVRPNGLGLPKGKYFRCLKPAEADGLCRRHREVFARLAGRDQG